MTRIGVTVPSRAASAETLASHFALAEEAGLDTAWSYEIFRDPLLLLAGAARRTDRIGLGTGIAVMSTRSPFSLANAAADVDELCGGRLRLGLGLGSAEIVRSLHGVRTDSVVSRTREYLTVLRRSWDYLAGHDCASFDGEHYRFHPRDLPYLGRPVLRRSIPVYLAAMGPRMTELAGELADGWIGFGLTPAYLASEIVDRLNTGTQRSGRSRPDVVLQVICSIDLDEQTARSRARVQVGSYVSHPMLDRVVQFHGLQDEQASLRRALRQQGPSALRHTSDALVDTFSIAGTPATFERQLAPYLDAADHVVLHPPYLRPLRQADSDQAFRATCAAVSHLASQPQSECPSIKVR